MSQLCPWSSDQPFAACCEPILTGAQPASTAESLMRSRYTAYTQGNIDYLVNSTHPKERHTIDVPYISKWSQQAQWHGLKILKTEKGQNTDTEGVVEFTANYTLKKDHILHHEIATFKREHGTWYFVDGKAPSREPVRNEAPKMGRNDPCACGSGKKYKKCCG